MTRTTLQSAPGAFGVSWSPCATRRPDSAANESPGRQHGHGDPRCCGASARGVLPGHLRLAGRVPKGISSPRCCRLPCRQYKGQPATAFCFLSWHARPASHSCRLRPPGIDAPRQLVHAQPPARSAYPTDRGITRVPVGGMGSPVRRKCGRCCLAKRLAWGVLCEAQGIVR